MPEILSDGYANAGMHYYATDQERKAFQEFEKAASYECFGNTNILLYLAHCYRTNNVVEPNEEDAKYYEDRAYGRPATRRPFWKRKKPPSLK